MENKKMQNFIEQLQMDDIDAHMLIGTLSVLVNNYSINKKEVVDELLRLTGMDEIRTNNVVLSCIYALGTTKDIDDRNKPAADRCQVMTHLHDPYEDVGREFLSMHHTLQQTAMSIFFEYVDKRSGEPGYETEPVFNDAPMMRQEYCDNWYDLPLI